MLNDFDLSYLIGNNDDANDDIISLNNIVNYLPTIKQPYYDSKCNTIHNNIEQTKLSLTNDRNSTRISQTKYLDINKFEKYIKNDYNVYNILDKQIVNGKGSHNKRKIFHPYKLTRVYSLHKSYQKYLKLKLADKVRQINYNRLPKTGLF